ncbi:MAG: hypothetical protein AB7O38_28360 [Pirellulaceae bacterium]
MRSVRRRRLGWLAVTLAIVVAAGCGPGKPTLVPISGRVTLNGKPLHLGSVQFVAQGVRPAYGQIDKDGFFSLETDGEPGCPIGQHKVLVQAQEISGTEATGEKMKQISPLKYASLEGTDLVVDVTEPKRDVRIELKSSP